MKTTGPSMPGRRQCGRDELAVEAVREAADPLEELGVALGRLLRRRPEVVEEPTGFSPESSQRCGLMSRKTASPSRVQLQR